jgi:hypothetical protein
MGQKIEGVIAPGSEQDSGTYFSVLAGLGQLVGKVDELVDELEEFGRVGHGGLSISLSYRGWICNAVNRPAYVCLASQ